MLKTSADCGIICKIYYGGYQCEKTVILMLITIIFLSACTKSNGEFSQANTSTESSSSGSTDVPIIKSDSITP